jgi:hypothetical protein
MDEDTSGLTADVDPRARLRLPDGLRGRSPLMGLSDFDVVQDITLDHMHLFCKGLCFRIMEMGFLTPAKRRSLADRLSLAALNPILLATKVPREMIRRTREFDFKSWKGEVINLYTLPPISHQHLPVPLRLHVVPY